MQINFNKYKLHLLLNFLTLDTIEYGYLFPLLEQTGIYSGYSDIILIAHQLSNKMQNVDYLDQKRIFSKKKSIFLKKYSNLFILYKNYLQNKQFVIKKLISHEFKTENCKEMILMCLVYILSYKRWKIKYWYLLISKLAFNCQEFSIAKYFLKKSKLELRMITMLIILLKKKKIILINMLQTK